MYAESRKIHLIEELLKTDDDTVLTELEAVFKKHGLPRKLEGQVYMIFWGR